MDAIDPGTTGRATPGSRPKVPARKVMERYQICDKTLDRWVASASLGFPQPMWVNRRRYFDVIELDEFDRRATRTKAAS
jgi:hypothetical protein